MDGETDRTKEAEVSAAFKGESKPDGADGSLLRPKAFKDYEIDEAKNQMVALDAWLECHEGAKAHKELERVVEMLTAYRWSVKAATGYVVRSDNSEVIATLEARLKDAEARASAAEERIGRVERAVREVRNRHYDTNPDFMSIHDVRAVEEMDDVLKVIHGGKPAKKESDKEEGAGA